MLILYADASTPIKWNIFHTNFHSLELWIVTRKYTFHFTFDTYVSNNIKLQLILPTIYFQIFENNNF